MSDPTGIGSWLAWTVSLVCGPIGFDCLLAAALSGDGLMLVRAILYMGAATAFLWGSQRI